MKYILVVLFVSQLQKTVFLEKNNALENNERSVKPKAPNETLKHVIEK